MVAPQGRFGRDNGTIKKITMTNNPDTPLIVESLGLEAGLIAYSDGGVLYYFSRNAFKSYDLETEESFTFDTNNCWDGPLGERGMGIISFPKITPLDLNITQGQ